MKHITTLIALALTLGTLVPLAAQTQMTAKEKRTQTRQERKIAQQKAREQLYQDAVRTLENNTFVLEADRLIFKRGRSVSVSSVKNFISMANKKATVQVSFDTPRPLQNGLGGFTVEGNVSDIRMKKDKKGKVKNFQLGICSIFVILAMIMACFNLNEIYSSIMILSGMMMVISTPFQEMKSLRENSNNR